MIDMIESVDISYYIFIINKFLNFLWNVLNLKAIEICSSFVVYIQSYPMSPILEYSSRFITYAPSFILSGKLSLE